jgi:hypothetical protein
MTAALTIPKMLENISLTIHRCVSWFCWFEFDRIPLIELGISEELNAFTDCYLPRSGNDNGHKHTPFSLDRELLILDTVFDTRLLHKGQAPLLTFCNQK